jgi:mRNA turnover protein 4
MGRSKREKVVALTATRKRVVGRDAKAALLTEMRGLVDEYTNIYVFNTDNMRNVKLKDLRSQWKDSRFYFGRKRIAQVAFGRDIESEHADGLHAVAEKLVGNVGILFTNRKGAEVREFFTTYSAADYARAGFVANEDISLKEGALDMFVPEHEPRLRALGLNVTLARGAIVLRENTSLCAVGDVLTADRAKLIEMLGYKLSMFKVNLLLHYNRETGTCEGLWGNAT